MPGQHRVPLGVGIVHQDEHQVEAAEQRRAHLQVLSHGQASVVVATDRVRGREDRASAAQRGDNTTLGNAHPLLLHCLQEGAAGVAAVLVRRDGEARGRGRVATDVDASRCTGRRRDQHLTLPHPWITDDDHVGICSQRHVSRSLGAANERQQKAHLHELLSLDARRQARNQQGKRQRVSRHLGDQLQFRGREAKATGDLVVRVTPRSYGGTRSTRGLSSRPAQRTASRSGLTPLPRLARRPRGRRSPRAALGAPPQCWLALAPPRRIPCPSPEAEASGDPPSPRCPSAARSGWSGSAT
eukprot:scaffold149_cov315-Pinguiococcus_pyrenoidosus.AAC.100